MGFEKGQPFFEYARHVNAVSTEEMAVDGSAAPMPFYMGPTEAGQVLAVNRLILYIEDKRLDWPDKFGNQAMLPAGHGITIHRLRNGHVRQDLLDGRELCCNSDLRRTFPDVVPVEWFSGSAFQSLTACWCMALAGDSILLDGLGAALRIVVRGDLSGLSSLTMNWHGVAVEA